jgi:GT2 family glycosyltransferase
LPEVAFWKSCALGISLRRLAHDARLVARLEFENRQGLPELFNARIEASDAHDILVFIHDDVWIDDYFFADRLIEGLAAYDVIGVAGNRRRVEHQPAWAFLDTSWTWDDPANLSGAVAHGRNPFGAVRLFGAVPADCELLDGVMLAARKSSLTRSGVRFDPRFDFHLYDMDFCRVARDKGLRLGTWPICVTHQSNGAFGTQAWGANHREYVAKWRS